ncbi:hypothetical protein K466DRAFT_663519 [Polyporus arcularius HHB13444]|uniref:Uncharacterized protein n=1 Tax=Polyporus arcularius HHB13444 TaxID=1314778 RepID=A0A5C3PBZ9_9APHY|nr:hypothetical protein K466DRAFT_663519 [Polyporus arcularius HHB13444]
MARPQSWPRTRHYGFRMGPEDVIKLAIHVKAQEPEGSKKLSTLPDDLSPPADKTDETRERIAKIRDWALGYIAKEADVSTSPRRCATVQDPEDTAHHVIPFIAFATMRVFEPGDLDLAACRLSEYVKEDIERVRALLPDDQGGWYRDFHDYAAEHPWSPPEDSPSTGDNPAA